MGEKITISVQYGTGAERTTFNFIGSVDKKTTVTEFQQKLHPLIIDRMLEHCGCEVYRESRGPTATTTFG